MADNKVEVRAAGLRGEGMFALCDIAAGSVVRQVLVAREITRAAPLYVEAGERGDHCTQVDGRTLLIGEPDCYMNHSCDPNCFYRYEGHDIYTVARRAIRVGEELSVDYLVNNSGGDSWPCGCGAERCRGVTGDSFFTLPASFQKEYRELLAPWFVARYGERLD